MKVVRAGRVRGMGAEPLDSTSGMAQHRNPAKGALTRQALTVMTSPGDTKRLPPDLEASAACFIDGDVRIGARSTPLSYFHSPRGENYLGANQRTVPFFFHKQV